MFDYPASSIIKRLWQFLIDHAIGPAGAAFAVTIVSLVFKLTIYHFFPPQLTVPDQQYSLI
jgi:hypothetical protein